MSLIHSKIDPTGLLEYSVVFTDRSLNHMSQSFQDVMRGLNHGLTNVYGAASCIIVPGGGTFAMESVARQFARNESVLIIRNGWFSYRWTQIFDQGNTTNHAEVARAIPSNTSAEQQFAPMPVDSICQEIRTNKPRLVVGPQVETSAGLLLPDNYIKQVAEAAHEAGAIFVLDCVAAGALWVDMRSLGVDVLITAPQKGWTATPCAGVVMLSELAIARLSETESDSFALDLKRWDGIMRAYLNGGHAYHATLPTDGLATFYQAYLEMVDIGIDSLKARQIKLGVSVRNMMNEFGFKSLAADGFQSPTVVVCHTTRDDLKNGSAFAAAGLQIAAGVPLQCGESDDLKTFRIGLFGIDKLMNEDRTLTHLRDCLKKIT
jgi:aspartate aminotransferase-like enzyme